MDPLCQILESKPQMQTTNVIGAPSASPFSALVTMFHSPSAAFAMLEPRRHAWFPLVLLTLFNTALFLWYFSVVDFAWLQEKMFASIPDAAQRENAMKFMSKGTLQAMTVGGALFTVPFVAALAGLYFAIVAKVRNSDFGFAKGFALSLWASVPALAGLVLGAMQILLNPGGQLEFSQLNPVSLNQLFFHVEMGRPWASMLDSLSVISIWSMVLLAIGYQVWAKVSRATAVKVVLLPYVVIYGIWAVVNLMSKAT
jgi:hypothetical protein